MEIVSSRRRATRSSFRGPGRISLSARCSFCRLSFFSFHPAFFPPRDRVGLFFFSHNGGAPARLQRIHPPLWWRDFRSGPCRRSALGPPPFFLMKGPVPPFGKSFVEENFLDRIRRSLHLDVSRAVIPPLPHRCRPFLFCPRALPFFGRRIPAKCECAAGVRHEFLTFLQVFPSTDEL